MALNKTLLPLALLLVLAGSAAAQNCSCPSNICCSAYGYCGVTNAYCGAGCRENCPSPNDDILSLVTDAFFNAIFNQSDLNPNCSRRHYFTRSDFLSSTTSYLSFANTGSSDDRKREIAAFFANYNPRLDEFCLKCEDTGLHCNPLLFHVPIPFKPALGFWMNNAHSIIIGGQGFGATMRAVTYDICNGKNTYAMNVRVNFYTSFCLQLGVDPGSNLTC